MSQPFSSLVLGTGNPGKLRELTDLLAVAGIPYLTPVQAALSLTVAESGQDYEANASKKALAFAQASGGWALADDSGLEVDALDGAPGLRSARLAGSGASDADRRARLLQMLQTSPPPWTARFRCTMVLAKPAGVVHRTVGICTGEIIAEERGEGGFGYDPIFKVAGTGLTMAELGVNQKNKISHRAKALHAMLPTLLELKEKGLD